MATGEYLATKSQDEVFVAEMALETKHLVEHRDHEREELRHMFEEMGLVGDDLDDVVRIIDGSDDAMLGVMAGLEFGVVDTEKRNPFLAGLTSAGLFLAGALPSVIPFAVFDDTRTALFAAALLAGLGLVIVGAVKTIMTKRNPFASASENLAIGLAGGVLSFLVGQFVESLIRS